MKKIGIYVHVPFCLRKCNYCDFYSVRWNENLANEYVEAVVEEAYLSNGAAGRCEVDTLFIGGGTPSVLSTDNIKRLVNGVKAAFHLTTDAEVTMEANPNSLSEEKLRKYIDIGINRLSIGIQSMDETVLKRIGRLHTAKESVEAVKASIRAGFDNINVDVMFNIPGQTVETVTDTLLRVMDMGVKHISFYSLKLEEGTPMFAGEKEHRFVMPDEDEERRMYYAGREIMEKHGFMQYEISNFARRGYECRHNLKYWSQQEYIGLGPAAHSFISHTRYSNLPNLDDYLQGSTYCREVQEIMHDDDMMFEYVMLNLRLNEGVDKLKFRQKFAEDFDFLYTKKVKKLEAAGLVTDTASNLRLTNRGIDLSNYVFAELL